MIVAKQPSLLLLPAVVFLAISCFCHSASACSGWLPGNCRIEDDQGYMMCNAGRFCSDFGAPANGCAPAELCISMCNAASRYGGWCVVDGIDWELPDCGPVTVWRRQMTIPGMGVVNCDPQIQLKRSRTTCSITRYGPNSCSRA